MVYLAQKLWDTAQKLWDLTPVEGAEDAAVLRHDETATLLRTVWRGAQKQARDRGGERPLYDEEIAVVHEMLVGAVGHRSMTVWSVLRRWAGQCMQASFTAPLQRRGEGPNDSMMEGVRAARVLD